MGAQLMFGTAGASGGGFSSQPGSLQNSFGERNAEPRWSWQCRSLKTQKDKYGWVSLWSFGCRTTGGDALAGLDGAAMIRRSMSAIDLYEPYSCDGGGTQSMNFLRGTCLDSSGTAVAGAIVQAFVTGSDTFQGEVQSNLDGTYGVGVQQGKSVPHYLVAYKPGSPDTTGATVNTLLPTNVDGS